MKIHPARIAQIIFAILGLITIPIHYILSLFLFMIVVIIEVNIDDD